MNLGLCEIFFFYVDNRSNKINDKIKDTQSYNRQQTQSCHLQKVKKERKRNKRERKVLEIIEMRQRT